MPPKVYITLTTIPSRLHSTVEFGVKEVLFSLCNQNYTNYEVHFNLPNTYALHDDKEYGPAPTWLGEFLDQYPHLKVWSVTDVGPITKLVPTLARIDDPEAILIVVDDDLIYHSEMINQHVLKREQYPDCALGYDGLDVKNPPEFGDVRDHFVVTVPRDVQVKTLQHYKSVSYLRKFFQADFLTDFAFKTSSDDIAVSCYMESEGIKKMVLNYADEEQISDLETWTVKGGVVSFPVVRTTVMNGGDGCQDPKYGLRFDIPQEFIDKHLI